MFSTAVDYDLASAQSNKDVNSLSQYWTDIYLSWSPENYPGVQNLRFPSDQIWTPDILLYNRSACCFSLQP